MTTETYLMLSKNIDINILELEHLTIGGVIDYAHTYSDELEKAKKHKDNKNSNVRMATQADIDRM